MNRFRYRRAVAAIVLREPWWRRQGCQSADTQTLGTAFSGFLNLLAELGKGVRQILQGHGQGALGKQAQGFELLEQGLWQFVLDRAPLASFPGARQPRPDNPGNTVGMHQLGDHGFRLAIGNMQALAKRPQGSLQRHQALPEEAPAMIAHGFALQWPRCEPAGINNVDT